MNPPTKRCAFCGADFQPKTHRSLYCTPKHAQLQANLRQLVNEYDRLLESTDAAGKGRLRYRIRAAAESIYSVQDTGEVLKY